MKRIISITLLLSLIGCKSKNITDIYNELQTQPVHISSLDLVEYNDVLTDRALRICIVNDSDQPIKSLTVRVTAYDGDLLPTIIRDSVGTAPVVFDDPNEIYEFGGIIEEAKIMPHEEGTFYWTVDSGFNAAILRGMVYSYTTYESKEKVNDLYKSWKEMFVGVPYSGPLTKEEVYGAIEEQEYEDTQTDIDDETYSEDFDEGAAEIISAEELLNDPYSYADGCYWVTGNFPPSTILDENENEICAIFADDFESYIELAGVLPTIGQCTGQVYGHIQVVDGKPVIEAEEYEGFEYVE